MNDALKQAVLEANCMLKDNGLVVWKWGNVSAVDRNMGEIVIKPTGIPYDELRLEHLVVCDLSGNILTGSLCPSTDLMAHVAIYRDFPACCSVAHTHSRMATAWAQAGLDLPVYGTNHADYFKGSVPCTRKLTEAEIEGDYEKAMGQVITETFRKRGLDPTAIPAALLCGHGPFVWGEDPYLTVQHAILLEEAAAEAYYTRILNPDVRPLETRLTEKRFSRRHSCGTLQG